VALPVLVFLLPILAGATIWLGAVKQWWARPLLLPSIVFLLSFAFTFAIRCLEPDISYTSDGISDLNMVNNFSQGETLPPPDMWMPQFQFIWYYDLQQYAASVLKRLLNVNVGEAYNVSHALLSALTCVAAAGAASRISGGRIWITLAVPVLIESTMTGSSAYLLLTSKQPSVWLFADLSDGMVHPPDGNWLWSWLFNGLPAEVTKMTPDQILGLQTLRLQVPGFWTWRDEYHANAAGHFLTLLAILVIAELVEPRKTIWPWVMAVLTPLLAVMASAWALPITALLCWVTLPISLLCGRRPASTGISVMTLFIALTLLWPAFMNVTSSPQFPEVRAINPLERVPPREFLVQWWPIIALWVAGLCSWKNLSFGLRWVIVVVPIMLFGIEQVDIESRYNTIEKMWGYTWGAGLVALFPFVASRQGLAFRSITIVLLASALITLTGGFMRDVLTDAWNGRWIDTKQVHFEKLFHLEGDHYLTVETGQSKNDEQRKKMLDVLRPYKKAVFLSGKCVFCYNEAPTLTLFTGNKSYIAWSYFESLANYSNEAATREKDNNDFYSGAMTDRLKFLQEKKITGVLIWPDDEIPDDFLAKLRQELDPAYEYIDCRGAGDKNAGVFIARAQS
jgi:Uncharacterized membrane protein (DUF2298)